MKILITGISGFLGSNIAYYGRESFNISGMYHTHFPYLQDVDLLQVDFRDLKTLREVLKFVSPEVVIHNAAMANPDLCEKDPRIAEYFNVSLTRELAILCNKAGIRFIFTSTDLVFDGNNPPYSEESPVNPLGVYAQTKVRAEKAVLRICPDVVVARISLMYGRGKAGLEHQSEWMERELRKRFKANCSEPLPLFTDQFRTIISVDEVAKALLLLANKSFSGIIHLGGLTRMSRYEFGIKLTNVLGIPRDCIKSASLKDIPQIASRPADVSLNCEMSRNLLGDYSLPIQQAMETAYSGNS